MIQGDNFTVDVENRNLPVLYNGGLPAEIQEKKLRKPFFNRKIKAIKWNDFFEVEKNKMKVFRIIPHLNCSNNQNRHLWNTLHKAYELYHSVNSRTTLKVTNGIKVTHREKDLIWFDILFKTEGEEKKIEFYFSTSETMAKKFKSILENRLNITCKDAEVVDLHVPEENTIVHELRYVKHDIFSLDTNHTTQTSPIGSILNTIDEMDSGDFARISICNEREDRKKWFNNAVWASKKLKKGNVPQRANINGKRIVGASKPVVIGFINELNSLVTDTLQAVSNVFTKSDNQFEKKNIIKETGTSFDYASMKIRDKESQSTWKTHIRTAVHSPVKFNRDNISNSITSSFTELSKDNELNNKKIVDTIDIKVGSLHLKIKGRKHEVLNELNNLQLSKKTKMDPNVNIMSSDELGKLQQFPTAELQRKFENSLSVNKKVETEIPKLFTKDGILIGVAQLKDVQIPIYIPTTNPNDLYRAFVAMGGMGSGKDTYIQNFVTEANLKNKISFVVIDQVNKEGKQGMANGIRDSLPPENIVDIDLSNDDFLPPLDLTEVIEKLGRKGADRFANELIEFMNVDDMGQSRKILRNFAKACRGSLYQLKELLENEEFRVNRIKELKKEGLGRVADELDKFSTTYKENAKGEVVIDKDGQKSLDSKASAILNRLDELLGDETLYSIFAQPPNKEFSLGKLMKEGKVIIFRVPDRILSTVAVRTLVHWITLQTLMTRLLMSNEDQANGCFVVYNEPQTYLSNNKGLAELMKRIAVQGRKERLGSIFACHHIGQISEISDDLISGGVHWLLFKNDNKKTFDSLSEFLKPTFEVETALNIPNTTKTRHAICIFDFDGEKQPAFLTRTLIPSYERYKEYDNSYLTKRHSRMYGRSIEEIEEMLSA
ncbi:ATP-binding protein [Metabacillus sp. B2-18]|uniref:ATP-binding protein n=1 Tax=Metabacillus sp. B2-18 TaxID=2897333 RepID=UPI001E32DDE6|nr:ATP-binding protein [Metabacillus sp. B2-18]UGB31727.1 ATP-binding protein [Metabacillus sp. B2-18]